MNWFSRRRGFCPNCGLRTCYCTRQRCSDCGESFWLSGFKTWYSKCFDNKPTCDECIALAEKQLYTNPRKLRVMLGLPYEADVEALCKLAK